jgi:hypothetical protein
MPTRSHTLHKKNISSGIRKKSDQKIVHKDVQHAHTKKQKITSPYVKKLKRFAKQSARTILLSPVFHSSFKILATAAVVSSMLYGSYLYIGKTFANEVVVSQSEIVARVGKLTSLPAEDPYEIVRVQDEEDLRKQNPFYKDVKEGQYILVYKNLAVIYDLRNNTIVGIKRD